MHSIGITKQIMKIAQDFLISTNKKYAEIIWFFSFEGMHRQIIG